MVVQGWSHGGRAAPGLRAQLHLLCWITHNVPCSLLTPCTSKSATPPPCHISWGEQEAGLFPRVQKKANRGKVN